jgi:LysM repeat protein
LTNTSTATPTSTPSNTSTATATPTATATSTNTFTPSPTPCFLRAGYVPYYVQTGDTLYGIAVRVGLSLSSLQAANCLTTTTIRVGQVILVPPGSIRPPTGTPIPVTPSPTRRK